MRAVGQEEVQFGFSEKVFFSENQMKCKKLNNIQHIVHIKYINLDNSII